MPCCPVDNLLGCGSLVRFLMFDFVRLSRALFMLRQSADAELGSLMPWWVVAVQAVLSQVTISPVTAVWVMLHCLPCVEFYEFSCLMAAKVSLVQ
jgi:hypothetical protein